MQPSPHKDAPEEAVKAITPELPTWEERVYDIVVEFGPITCREIAFKLHKESGFVSARLNQLREDGRVMQGESARAGTRGCRHTRGASAGHFFDWS
jgi:hypothetical protein